MPRKRLRQSLKWHERFRWVIFQLFETLSELRRPDAQEKSPPPSRQAAVESLWVFVSTIGELNAISTLLQRLLQERADLQLVLISDHEHYEQPYLAKYPNAVFFYTRGASRSAKLLGEKFPPRLLIIGEIPCFPSEAPCRFSYAFLRTAKMHGATIALVNAWLYGESPACLMDKLEYRLLKKDYLDAIDLACVQTDEIRDVLTKFGMEPSKLNVTGNMKFDGLRNEAWAPEQSPSKAVLHPLIEGRRPIIVIGCMHNPIQQTLVIESFSALLKTIPDALMIFAHRHPEVQRNLDKLVVELNSNNIRCDHRSKLRDSTVAADTQCLILDTTGELKDFYAIAHVAYVGADHNLLEPLSFRKAVSTVSAWTKGLPNYPIFLLLRSAGAIVVADEKEALSAFWDSWLSEPDSNTGLQEKIDSVLRDAAGATEKNIRLIELSDPQSSHIQQLR